MKHWIQSTFIVLLLVLIAGMGRAQSAIDSPRVSEDTVTDKLKWVEPGELERSSKGGARVEAHLLDGSMLYGDLLSVSDTTVSIYVYKNSSYAYSRSVHSGTQDIALRDLARLVINGRSKILQGIFIGFLGGMVTGTVVTRVVGWQTHASDLAGPGALGGIGLVVGSTVGYLSSGKDLEIRKFGVGELTALKSLCRSGKK